MTTAQLITELEKRGVLEIERGDLVLDKRDEDLSHDPFLITRVAGDEIFFEFIGWKAASRYTHSADDPRLLGRVLRELGPVEIKIYEEKTEVYGYGYYEDSNTENHLIHAALKALLAKVEGEQDTDCKVCEGTGYLSHEKHDACPACGIRRRE